MSKAKKTRLTSNARTKYSAIERIENMTYHPVTGFLLSIAAELHEKGIGGNVAPFHYSHKALAIRCNDKIVAAISYCQEDWRNAIMIYLGGTAPDHRGRGLYRKLWNELVKVAREKSIPNIIGGTSADNVAMMDVMISLGRKEKMVEYHYSVTP